MIQFRPAVKPKNLRGIPTSARFWIQVDRAPQEEDVKAKGCWLWRGHLDSDGYGRLRVDGKSTGAHVFSYELQFGPLPEGMGALHTCDTRACVYPWHLYPGTVQDNADDMKERERSLKGERNHKAKLDAQAVLAIRAMYDAGEHNKSRIARQFNVTNALIGKIIRRELWKHI